MNKDEQLFEEWILLAKRLSNSNEISFYKRYICKNALETYFQTIETLKKDCGVDADGNIPLTDLLA